MEHKYFHKFNNESEFYAAYYGADYSEPWVSAIYNANAKTSEDFAPAYNKGDEVDITS